MKRVLALCFGILFLLTAGCGGSKSNSATTPEAVAKAYYQALKDGKPDVAYNYRKFSAPKTKEQFVQERKGGGMTFKEFTIGKAEIKGNKATVPVTFKTGSTAMPELTISTQLENDKGWKITSTAGGGGAPAWAAR